MGFDSTALANHKANLHKEPSAAKRPPCKPNTSKLARKIEKLEWRFKQAIKISKGAKISKKLAAARIMRSYENLVRKPQYTIVPGFRLKKVKAVEMS